MSIVILAVLIFVLRKSGKAILQPDVVINEATEVTKPNDNEQIVE